MSTFKVNNNTFNGPAVIGSDCTISISGGHKGAVCENQNEPADVDSAKDRVNCSDSHDIIHSSMDSPRAKMGQSAKNNHIHQPIVFISYSWDCESHKSWVKEFATDLRSKGISVICDQDAPYGTPLPNFMKSSIYDSDRILIIGTPEYLRRSRERGTGCQFEDYIITENIYNKVETLKFIPILRVGTFQTSFPPLIASRKGFDFSIDTQYNEKLDELVQSLLRDIRTGHLKNAST